MLGDYDFQYDSMRFGTYSGLGLLILHFMMFSFILAIIIEGNGSVCHPNID